ncbi:hypothetical protein C8A00DRAFT_38929 [Chaetomidium leptoderma]|uniref:Uncharacterized protein n=1 Tax=Chaetomidium leptoderma TaxID=669021 RepID=A0AAN6VBT1_9PEZI|nr:hypothetical protein C8A00DRAFT_38929 [Chaetomidium leptoderma]
MDTYYTRGVNPKRVSALASLCSTSRQLNSDLAQLAKSLSFSVYPGMLEFNRPPEVVDYVEEQRTAYIDALPDAMQKEYAIQAIYDVYEDFEDCIHPGNVEIDILTSLCPNLETLCADRRSQPRPCKVGPGLDNFQTLLRAAPNLTNMTLHMVKSCVYLYITHDKLTDLDFRCSSFSGQYLVAVLRACPNLEIFKDALLMHAPKLKAVLLSAGKNARSDEDWEVAEVEELGRVLEQRGVRFEYRPYEWE